MSLLRLIVKFLINIGQPIYKLVRLSFLIDKALIWGINKLLKFDLKVIRKIYGWVKWQYVVGILILGSIVWGGWYFYAEIVKDLPDANLIYTPPKLSTKIVDRNGNLLYKFYEDENRTWVPLNKIPESLIQATLAIEDKDFYNHHGISLKGLSKAVLYNFRNSSDKGPRGGSTITQQLVKNVFLTREKSLKRKIKEAILTVLVERKLSKDEILERYFNQVPYGGEAYGVQEAAQKFFGKNVWDLNLAESAFLAGLPAAPSSYSPFGSNPEYGYARQRHVVEEMVNAKFISREQADKALNQKIEIVKEKKRIKAPHFVFYIKSLLEQKYGLDNFGSQGLTVVTSLDLNVQNMAENIVKEEVDKIKNLRISNGAALVVDPKSGDILAMVGSKDYYSDDIDGKFNVTTGLRQPGSSIKPINYLLALEKGSNLNSTINDSPVTYYVSGQKPYSPQNYNGKYMGNVTLKTALASSLNIPSVKLLAQNGVSNMIDLAESMGISTWKDRNRFGLSLALGSGEVKMTEIAQAYSVFANLGKKIEINPILKIENYLNETIYESQPKPQDLIKPEYAYLINDALSDNQARAPIFGLNSKLVIPGKTVAVKTGTTNNLKDNWCIGWTPSYLVATWVGNNDSSPMSWVASGVTGATPIWNRITGEILKNKNDEKWEVPSGIYKENICGKDEYLIQGMNISTSCHN
jgi:1A family penicillin-binding protein